MKKSLLILFVLVFGGGVSFAQFSLNKFWNIELGGSISSVKQLFPNEKWEEVEAGNDNLYSFLSYLEPSSIKVSFIVTKADRLRMKSISNGKVDEESAKKLFEHLKKILLKKFGNKYEEKDTIGKIILVWQIDKDGKISLSNNGDKTLMVFFESVGIPFNGGQNGK